MKAAMVLILIYVGTFLVAIQGASQNPVQAARQNAADARGKNGPLKGVDPAKDADIRSLLELIGARDTILEVSASSAEQYREKAAALAPTNERAQALAAAYLASYQKNFDPDAVVEQLVASYDRHFTDEEIKGLLQFYGSPLGQKTATETPRILKELQVTSRAASTQAAREAFQTLRAENPKRPFAGRRDRRPSQPVSEAVQANSQQP